MTQERDNIAHAKQEGCKTWLGLGRPGPGVLDLEALAHSLGLLVQRGDLTGSTARLNFLRGRGVIRLSTHGSSRGRERFSIAHEIGHLVLHAETSLCHESDLEDVHSDHNREAEANAFAAELLMPRPLLTAYAASRAMSVSTITETATQFKVSATAAAHGLLGVTHEPCAIIMCQKGRVAWKRRTEDFWPLPADRIPSKSLVHHRGPALPDGRECVVEDWCVTPKSGGTRALWEEVLPMPAFGAALVLLTFVDP